MRLHQSPRRTRFAARAGAKIAALGGGMPMLEKNDVRSAKNGRHGRQESTQTMAKGLARPAAAPAPSKARPPGIKIRRYFTKAGDDGFTHVQWDLRTAAITGENGKVVFEQKDVEAPRGWSQTATNVVVQKYFRGTVNTPERERSVRQLISPVADTITAWGLKDGYCASPEDADLYRAELRHLLVEQKMSFNSPVWFNVGSE